ncbi:hypothetical protein [Brevundimonas sp.]|uniref:hypothetical protein n=1 Tax=Brevundimonas sp. TaxID=1871086 RepID=UPI002D26491A|nr:hypothetical protein [Brevundimonas sp.]HYD27492.1 hypothetical protein [Brevundimonas sp.]
MVAFALAIALAAAPMQEPPQEQAAQQAPQALEDVVITGRPLDDMIRRFVDEIAAPNRGRGIARWRDRICIGVANLRTEPAQYIVDRVSTVAGDIGLTPGQPGCAPNVIIIASDQPAALAEALVAQRRRAFRMGGSGMDRGNGALRAFVASEAPVRWWQVSMPVDARTGQRATRLPGECTGSCAGPMSYAPVISATASRISTPMVDDIFRTIVILDMIQADRISARQLADYVSMVVLAQIDPEADTSGYASILNVFDDPAAAAGLTDWDQAYLAGLYDAERTRKNLTSGRAEIARSIYRAHQDLHAGDEE